MKIIFAGTPEFAATALRAILQANCEVIAVYTQPDRPAGRGRKLTLSPVKQLALEHNIAVLQPQTLKSTDAQHELAQHHADAMVVAAYGLLLPEAVLKTPRLGCINIHASLLPRWRGAAPIQRAIEAGDKETGITIMQMDVGLDTGDMLLKKHCPIEPTDTTASLHDKLAELGGAAIVEALSKLASGELKAQKQDDSLAVYAHKLNKSEALIDWHISAAEIERKIRAFNPWPVAQTGYDNQALRIWEADLLPDPASATAGEVIATGKDGIDVATGRGVLRIKKLQLPGGKPLQASQFLNAHDVLGYRFS